MQQIAPASGESQASMYQHTYPLGAPFREDDLQPESGDARDLVIRLQDCRAATAPNDLEEQAALITSFAIRIRAEAVEECAKVAESLGDGGGIEPWYVANKIRQLGKRVA